MKNAYPVTNVLYFASQHEMTNRRLRTEDIRFRGIFYLNFPLYQLGTQVGQESNFPIYRRHFDGGAAQIAIK